VTEVIGRTNHISPLLSVIDILVVAAIFYWILGLVKGTRAVPVLRGLAIILVSSVALLIIFQITPFKLRALDFLLQRALLPGFVVAIPVIFQPELRRALERIGTSTTFSALYSHSETDEITKLAQNITKAVTDLADRRIGALIVIERETGLEDIADTGTRIDACADPGLLESIFMPNGPLHDGAVIISRGRIVAAGCVLPLSENMRVLGERGTRHRAALGVTETSDAIAVVVSEETGVISVAQNGRLLSNFTEERLMRFLTAALKPS